MLLQTDSLNRPVVYFELKSDFMNYKLGFVKSNPIDFDKFGPLQPKNDNYPFEEEWETVGVCAQLT